MSFSLQLGLCRLGRYSATITSPTFPERLVHWSCHVVCNSPSLCVAGYYHLAGFFEPLFLRLRFFFERIALHGE